MTDPYTILQIQPDASDDEVKSAYRELARKYHPDNYSGNPLSDLATEKMQEINEAYDAIMQQRRSGDSGRGYAQDRGCSNNMSQFADIRRLINMRRITEAEELLDGVQSRCRDAEWHFLKGTVQQFRGWLDDAYENYAQACRMEPQNAEYHNAFSQLQWQRQNAASGYRASPYGSGCSVCDICTALYCADCLCNCFGGGCR